MRIAFHTLRLALICLLLHPASALACAVCYGKADSSLQQGANMGIFVLLVFIGIVLAGISSFFVFVARRSAKVAATVSDSSASESISQPSNHAL